MQKTTGCVRAVAGLGLLLGMAGAAFAANPPATGLGQSWPNATDVSRDTHYHAYAFVLNGIKYVQINDANGNVLGAIGTSNGQFITLPVGRYAQHVHTPQQPASVSAATPITAPVVVYQDDTTQITAAAQSDGTMMIQAAFDPIEASSRIQ